MKFQCFIRWGFRNRWIALVSLILISACTANVPSNLPATATSVVEKPTATATEAQPTPVKLATITPTQRLEVTAAPLTTAVPAPDPERLYSSQPGDTLIVIANRLGVLPEMIECVAPCPIDPATDVRTLLPYATKLLAPTAYKNLYSGERLLPDSEVVFSSAAESFKTAAFVQASDGFLNHHRQYLMMNAWNTGAEIVALVAEENSINPRLLLALLEHQCGCVLGDTDQPEPYMQAGFYVRHDLYGQLIWAVHELSNGYYGWRAGTLTQLTLTDGTAHALHPDLNAGTVALYNLFSKLHGQADFARAIGSSPESFIATYAKIFGNPWLSEVNLFPDGLQQPVMELPFEQGVTWSYTGGPHPSFESNGPLASLDFAPASAEPGCQPTTAWVTAVADGLVVRSEYGLLIQDLDGDGSEHTGWNVMYLHVSEIGRVPVGTYLNTGDRLGQPSCEGGTSNGTHLHIARKYNGEWIPAGSGPMPFVMDGWRPADGPIAYKGTLHKEDTTLEACTCSWRQSWIKNED